MKLPTLLLACTCMLGGCAGAPIVPATGSSGECPEPLRTGVHLTASIAQVEIPDGVEAPSGPVRLVAGAARRILLFVEVPQAAQHVRLLTNSLEISTYGGTLAGWARVDQPAGAMAHESLQVDGGFMRIAPFVPGGKLRAYTQAVDVLIVPGGEPESGLALRPGAMWNDAGAPTAPQDLKILLEPIQHMTALTVVDAKGRFEFTVAQQSRAHERSDCSVDWDVELLDHDSVLPRLWTLQHVERFGPKHPTIGLYNQSVGPFPALFLDPATAAGFARWLSETRATRVAEYEIGLVAPENATGFQLANDEDLTDLVVKQLGAD